MSKKRKTIQAWRVYEQLEETKTLEQFPE
ncbi:hypothetical protein BSG1_18465 [Bacillus sp. SG-1]|nr:hypothetical protein BSG1_18465 [Bacillus sp. SG-1]